MVVFNHKPMTIKKMRREYERPGENIWSAWYRVQIPVGQSAGVPGFAIMEDDTRYTLEPELSFVKESDVIDSLKEKSYLTFKEFKRVLCFYKQKCAVCGETYLPALDFHHRNPKDKLFEVSQYFGLQTRPTRFRPGRKNRWHAPTLSFGVECLFEEIAKCDVLCATHHRKEHHADHRDVYTREFIE